MAPSVHLVTGESPVVSKRRCLVTQPSTAETLTWSALTSLVLVLLSTLSMGLGVSLV